MAWKVAPVAYAATAAGRPAVSTRRRTRAMRVHTTQIANEIVVTYGLIGIEPPKASKMPPTVETTAKHTLRIGTNNGEEDTRKAAAAGRHEEREHQQGTHDLHRDGGGKAEQQHEYQRQGSGGDAVRGGDVRVHAREHERTPDQQQGDDHDRRDDR